MILLIAFAVKAPIGAFSGSATMPSLVLASTSRYRRELLERLDLPFETASPEIDETPFPDETPLATARRLAEAKARAVAPRFPDALIIGSDQVATLGSEVIGKPGDHANALKQLQQMRGRDVIFHTALCLYNTRCNTRQVTDIPTRVRFRNLDDEALERYLLREQPYDCAGSAKSEALGIALLETMTSDDPTALIGLPLITLCSMLAQEGLAVL